MGLVFTRSHRKVSTPPILGFRVEMEEHCIRYGREMIEKERRPKMNMSRTAGKEKVSCAARVHSADSLHFSHLLAAAASSHPSHQVRDSLQL